MSIFPNQDSFNRGEISPRLHSRASLDLYKSALSRCENFITLPHGGIRKRGATRFVGEVKDSSKQALLIPFIFSKDQAYALELGNLTLRIFAYGAPVTQTPQNITGITKANPGVVTYSGTDTYANGDRVILTGVVGMTEVNNREFTVANLNAGANTFELSGVNTSGYTTYVSGGTVAEIIELVTPWLEADLDELMFYQSADEMWLVHEDYAPQLLTRTSNTVWTLAEFSFDDGPYLPINDTATTMTPAESGAVHPAMTTPTAPSGTAAADTNTGDAFKVFDRSLDTNYNSGNPPPHNISYDFAGAATKVCDAYWILVHDTTTFVNNAPISWTFEGWNGASWIVLDTRLGEAAWSKNERRYFEFNNKTAYQSYRINVIASQTAASLTIVEMGWHESGDTQTAFNLTASSIVGINEGTGFQPTDVGRAIRLLGSDNVWRWARIVARTSITVVTIRLYGHALPDLGAIVNWRMSVFEAGSHASAVTIFEERLAIAQRFSAYLSKSFQFENYAPGSADDDALAFTNAGGGQANDILWLADADGFLLLGMASGVRALSGSGYDEALTPSSFKNRKSRTYGCAKIAPADAGASFLYVTRSRKALAELVQDSPGKFSSNDVGQISEHIPKRGVVEIAFQTDPDPILWFPLETGEMGGYTHQPSQEVRGMHRHIIAGALTGAEFAVVERAIVTPGQDGNDDVWLIVRRTIGGATKRYIEILTTPFEYGDIEDAFQVDCGLTYEGAAVTTVTGLFHLALETVDVFAGGIYYPNREVSATGSVSLPGGSAAATPWHVGLPFSSEADTLELDVGGRDGSLIGRRKRISEVIISVFETDLTGLEISSYIRDRWEIPKKVTIAVASASAVLTTGNIRVPVDDSWDGMARLKIRHRSPTPCTIRGLTPVFENEP